jgi:hypothetical protein
MPAQRAHAMNLTSRAGRRLAPAALGCPPPATIHWS